MGLTLGAPFWAHRNCDVGVEGLGSPAHSRVAGRQLCLNHLQTSTRKDVIMLLRSVHQDQ